MTLTCCGSGIMFARIQRVGWRINCIQPRRRIGSIVGRVACPYGDDCRDTPRRVRFARRTELRPGMGICIGKAVGTRHGVSGSPDEPGYGRAWAWAFGLARPDTPWRVRVARRTELRPHPGMGIRIGKAGHVTAIVGSRRGVSGPSDEPNCAHARTWHGHLHWQGPTRRGVSLRR